MEWAGPCLLADSKSDLPSEVKFTCPMARYRNVSFQIIAEAPTGTVWTFEYYLRLERDAPWVKAPDTYNDQSNPLTNAGSCIHAFRILPVCSDIQMRVTHTSQDCSAVRLRVWMVQWADSAAGVSGVPMPPISEPAFEPPREVSTFNEIIAAGYNWLANANAPTEVPPIPAETNTLPVEPTDEDEADMARFRQLQKPA